ncbi:MAG: tetratricopeptide repeat protein [Myxococcota bacterium]
MTVIASIARAQTGDAPPPAPAAAAAPAAPAAAADAPVVVAAPSTEQLRGAPPSTFADLWGLRRRALADFDRAAADALLNSMVEAKQAAGWPNLTTYGLAVARESVAIGNTGEVARALRLSEAASKLAPSRPETWVARAHANFDGGQPLAAATDLAHAATAILTDPIELRLRLGNLALAAIAAVLVGAFVFAVIVLYRHGRELIFGVLQVLPNGATRLQAALIVTAVIATPLLVAVGPVWTVLIWIALPIAYYDRNERIGACIIIAFLAVLPLLLPKATEYLGYPGSRAQDLYLAATDMGAETAAARVRAQPKPTGAELLALGLRERYAGRLPEATRLIEQSLERGIEQPSVYTILGNLKFAAGDRAGAIAAYEKALSRDPKHVPALFNLSRVYFSMTEHQKAGEAHRSATAIDYEIVELFDRDAKQQGPAYMAPAEVPRRVFASHNTPAPLVSIAAHDVWRELSGRTIPLWYIGIAVALCFLVGIVGIFKKGTKAPTTLAAKAQQDLTKSTIEPLQRIRHEIEVHRHSIRLLRMRRVASVFIAGAGQLMVGRALSGLAFLVVFMTSVFMLLIGLDIVPSPVPLAGGPSLLALIIYAGAAGVAYLMSLIDAQTEDL